LSISLQRLLPLFERERHAGAAMVLATVVRTEGPTYTKPGAHMLISASGEYAGLLSGGCLEGDLAQHGRGVLSTGQARLVTYDMRGSHDLIFGLGSGCEGAMDILLQRLDPARQWEPMNHLATAWQQRRVAGLTLVARSSDQALPAGTGVLAPGAVTFGPAAPDSASMHALQALSARLASEQSSRYLANAIDGVDVLWLSQPAPTRILLLGAGPDARPVAQLAGFLGWVTTVIDHRSDYARAEYFPTADRVLDGGMQSLTTQLAAPDQHSIAAAIVMSHHLVSDLGYLRTLAHAEVPYVGLLGPAVRRDRLLSELGSAAASLRARLHAPIGLDLGASSPEAIALSIVAEIHATLAGRASMLPMSRKQA
jgi:xanthine dehydrogenase accessory factor